MSTPLATSATDAAAAKNRRGESPATRTCPTGGEAVAAEPAEQLLQPWAAISNRNHAITLNLRSW
jgi:hypothetical protein